MKIYVDLDGVIFDSETLLFDEEYRKLNIRNESDKIKYIQNKNWYEMLRRSEIINNSINILKGLRKDICILTKIHSMENEGVAKIRILRESEIQNNIILVPYPLKKSDVVNPEGSILVDDTIHNLDDWKIHSGIPIYFNKDNSDIDGWHNVNKEYVKIKSLDYLRKFE